MLPLLLLSFLPIGTAAADDAPPGSCNVFVRGDDVRIPLPEPARDAAQRWRALDDALAEVRRGPVEDGAVANAGALPVGWYRFEFLAEDGRPLAFTTAAVLAPLAVVPPDSPVCLDVALSWLADDDPETWRRLARLASLAGARWVRDRIHWREMQTGPGDFVEDTKYDATARLQSDAGLDVLQVFHTVPAWARDPAGEGARPRTDLRRLHRFCAAMAERFHGRVRAWEPWNEGNAGNFGGYPMDALCSHQKAAYLGFKAGDPGLPVFWGPLGGVNTAAQADAILANETWPYYDVYTIHSYDWAHAYATLWGPARRAASGREIWVTESDRGMAADPASPVGDFTHDDARRKAEFIAQSYACSLFSGASRHFHFILGPYMEGNNTIQFGLLRKDYTPRLSYAALAAVGRFLAGARCLGRWELPDAPDTHVYGFRARPDGAARDVLVAWVEKEADWPERGAQSAPWPLPGDLRVEAAYDYLGRERGAAAPERLTSAPVFVLLAAGTLDAAPLHTIPPMPRRPGEPSPVVLQFDTPDTPPVIRQRAWTPEPERVFPPGATVECRLLVYNFSDVAARGAIALGMAPEGWGLPETRWEVAVPPMERQTLEFRMTAPAATAPDATWLVFRGDFGPAGSPVVAVQAHVEPVESS